LEDGFLEGCLKECFLKEGCLKEGFLEGFFPKSEKYPLQLHKFLTLPLRKEGILQAYASKQLLIVFAHDH